MESWGDYPGKRDPSLIEDLPKRLADGVTRVKGIHHCRFDYMPGGYSEVADSTQVRRFFGNKHGTLDKSVEGGGVTSATYRDDGHILSSMDPMGGSHAVRAGWAGAAAQADRSAGAGDGYSSAMPAACPS